VEDGSSEAVVERVSINNEMRERRTATALKPARHSFGDEVYMSGRNNWYRRCAHQLTSTLQTSSASRQQVLHFVLNLLSLAKSMTATNQISILQ